MAYHRSRAAAQVSLLALMMAVPAGQAYAQSEVEELIVTARKRDEALIDVPFSVNAVSEERMREKGVSNIEDLSRNIASFTVQNLGPGQSQVAIRGISAGQIVRDQPGVKEQVGVYLDESVISLSLFTPDLDLFDLSRVEVLRGPQGTLYGSGSLSGTVRYITNQPKLDTFESAVEATVNSVKSGETGGELKAAVNIPITDGLALRVAAYATSFPGFIDAVQPGGKVNSDVNGGSRLGFRASMLIQPIEQLKITPRVVYQTIDVDGFNRVDIFNIFANPYTTTRPPVRLGDLQQFTQLQEKFEDDFLLGDLNIEYDFGPVTLTSISTFTDRDVLVVRDATALTGSITGGSIGLPAAVYTLDAPLLDETNVKSLTQEIRLASNGDGPLTWVIGGFYSHIDRDYSQALPVIGFEALTGIPTQGPAAPKDVLYYSTVPYKQKQYALFGEATWSVNDRLDVTAGLRWSSYEETRSLTFDGIFAERTIGVPGSTDADDFAPRVIVAYKVNDALTLNAQASKGFRLGGINDPLNRPLCTAADFATFNALSKPSFDNETVWNYEAGLKASLGGRGSLTVAAFYADIENLQATIDAGSCSSRVIVNVPDAKSAGVEAEFSYRLSDDFDLAASASYNNAELTSSVLDSSGKPLQGLRDGNRLPTVPEFQAAISLNFSHEMENGWRPFANVTWQYVGDRFTQISDQEDNPRTVSLFGIGAPTVSTLSFPLELPDYQVVNLRGGLRYGAFEAAIFVQNVTDERAWLSVDRERGLRARYGYQTNQPRTVGVTIRKSF
jgi:iron complex outermembrane receptor protein